MFRTSPLTRLLLHAANLLVIIFILLPVAAVVTGSIQSEKALQADTRRLLPLEVTLRQFHGHPDQGPAEGPHLRADDLPAGQHQAASTRPSPNSAIIAVSVTFFTLLFGALSAYTIARQRYRWTLFLLQANIVARFVPAMVMMIPLYIVMRSLGQLNSLSGVITAETGFLLPYAILILAPYFDTIPGELEEAARIDGCTRLRRLRAHRAAARHAGAGGLRRHHVHHLVARAAHPADPERAAGLHDPAGGHRQPGRRRARLLQPDDGDLPARLAPTVILVVLLQKYIVGASLPAQ